MDEDNILKKKKINNKNNYRYHHNQCNNKNYYYKKKKKNLILENNDSSEVENIISFNEVSKQEEIPKIEIPVIKAYELIKEKPLECKEMSIPEKKNKLNILSLLKISKLKYGMGLAVLLIALFGVSYSYFNYTKIDSRQADIASGEVYVKVLEDTANITLNKMYPREDEEARSRNDNYFDFTVIAKNTSETKAVLYSINFNNGANISGKTRIDPKYIKLDLQEKTNGEYSYVLGGVKLSDFSYQGIVPTETNNEITKEYRLRIWVSDEVIISDTESNASYTQQEFANLYANFNISVDSEDKEIAYSMFAKNADTTKVIDFANASSASNGQGLYILPGTESNQYPIYYYRGAIDNNNVVFGGFCWQMVRTTETGGIKMIYNGLPDIEGSGDNITYNCGTTRDIQGTIRTTTSLSSSTGYYYADDYEIVSTTGNSVTYRLKAGTNSITQVAIANATDAATNIPTISTNYPYTCKGTTDTETCTTLYKVDSYASGTNANVYSSLYRTIIGRSAFNIQHDSVSDVGYMSNTRFVYSGGAAASGSIFGKDIEWDGSNYLVIEDTEHTASTNETLDADHHYTCGTAGTTGCASVRYYYYNSGSTYYYITLSNGDLLEDALYKMTGNGSDAVKLRNNSYVLNQNNSTAKTAIDNWFRTNLTDEDDASKPNYEEYLEDTIYCNDRSYTTTGSSKTYTQSGWNPNGGSLVASLYFGTHNRFNNSYYSTTNVPNVSCPNEIDRFTVSNTNGNGALTYPVGLLTADEIILAGVGGNNASTSTYYLYTNDYYWSLSPSYYFLNGNARGFRASVSLDGSNVFNGDGLRPVVSLRPGTEFESGGNGEATSPFVVKYN